MAEDESQSDDSKYQQFFEQKRKAKRSHKSLVTELKEHLIRFDEVNQLIADCGDPFEEQRAQLLARWSEQYFDQWSILLVNGFNIITYGVGSKRRLLERYRDQKLQQQVVMCVDGFFPAVSAHSVVEQVARSCLASGFGCLDTHADRLAAVQHFFNKPDSPDLILIIHNIDGSSLRDAKSQQLLAKLAGCAKIHVVASIDHVNAPLLWHRAEMKQFNWIWFDATTFERYQVENANENSLLFNKKSVQLVLGSMRHVFGSLNTNAQRIFAMLARHQLSCRTSPDYKGLAFSHLYRQAREQFLVTNQSNLRSQLGEFKDHRLVKIKRGDDGVEYLLINVDQATLKNFLQEIEADM